jgi:hypothetical protein
MAQQKPKGMSKKTYDFLCDLSFTHEEIEVIWRMIFNDVCKAYNVSQKVAAKSIKKTAKKKTTKKKTAKKAEPYYDGKNWYGTEPTSRTGITFWPASESDKELYIEAQKKEKDQISVSSLIKDEAKKIEQDVNAARRKSIIEGTKKRESEENDELPRKPKKRRGAW